MPGTTYLTRKEAAQHFNQSGASIRRMIEDGMPHVGSGKKLRILKTEAETWVLTTTKAEGKKMDIAIALSYTFKWNDGASRFIAKVKKHDGSWHTKQLPADYKQGMEAEANAFLISWCAAFWSSGSNTNASKKSIDVAKIIPTIDTYADRWLSLKQASARVSPNYYLALETAMRAWIQDHAKHAHLHLATLDMNTGFTGSVIAKWLGSIDNAPASKLSYALALRVFFNDSIIQGWVATEINPMDQAKVKEALKDIRAEIAAERNHADYIKTLSEDAASKLLNDGNIPTLRRMRYLLALTTGLRDSELMGLIWDDVKQSKGGIPYLEINRQLQEKGTAPCLWKPSTASPNAALVRLPKGKKTRNIPLHPLAFAALTAWRERHYREHTGKTPERTLPILGKGIKHRGPGKVLPAGSFTKVDNEYCVPSDFDAAGVDKAAGQGRNIVFHDLRHTFSTLLKQTGCEEDRVERLLGHGKKTTARDSYISPKGDLGPDYEAVCALPFLSMKLGEDTIKAGKPVVVLKIVKG